jgi:hypothetical protein
VDIAIEEPTGAVCSLRNPRTTGGGVLVGDAFARSDQLSADGVSEIYVCPVAFDGTYRVLVRRVWGKIPSGKVTVDVYLHYGKPEQKRLRKQIPLAQEDALVVFELEGGRRLEPLAQQQLANAAADQVAVGQQLLAQQLMAAAGGTSLRDFLRSRRNQRLTDQILDRTRGAVGFMPVIVFIPEGANLQVSQAIISADRRYVRVTPLPFFSQILAVRTFNFFTGQSGTSGGGSGGGLGGGGGFF